MPRSRTGEGRVAGRKEDCQQWTKALGRSQKRYLCHLGVTNIYPQLVLCHIVLYRNMSFKASFTGMNCQSPHDDLPAASSERFAIAFPDVCKKKKSQERRDLLNLGPRVYSEKMALGAPSCLWRKQTQRLPSPRRPGASLRHATVPGRFV